MNNKKTDDIFERVAESVTTPEQLQVYIQAQQAASQSAKEPPIWQNIAFYKFLGGTIGASIAALVFLTSEYVSSVKDAFDVSNNSMKILRTNTQELSSRNAMLSEELLELNREIVTSVATRSAIEEELIDLVEDRNRAKIELQRLNLELDNEKRLSKLLGTTLTSCENEPIRRLFNRVTDLSNRSRGARNQQDRPLRFGTNYTEFSLEIFLLGDGDFRYNVYGRTDTMPFSERRAAAGFWSASATEIVLNFAFDRRVFSDLTINLDDAIQMMDGEENFALASGSSGISSVFSNRACNR